MSFGREVTNKLIDVCISTLQDDKSLLKLNCAKGSLGYLKTAAIRKLAILSGDEQALTDLNASVNLVPGVYEGGFKVWECSKNMIELIDDFASSEEPIVHNSTRVLEIGCGGGLIGIKCLLLGAAEVHFQDFNSGVLRYFTIPNIIVNIRNHNDFNGNLREYVSQKCKFFSGDWSDVKKVIGACGFKYDRIFSCETIYNQANYPKLIQLIKGSLAPGGYAYIGAKCFYFGCDGGIETFRACAIDQGLSVVSLRIIRDNLQKEILRVSL